MGKAVHQCEVVAISGGLDARGLENILLHVLRETLARDSLYNRDQELEAGDGPVPLRSWVVHPVFPGIERHHSVQRFGLPAGRLNGIAEIMIIDDARGVVEQLAYRYMMALEGK